jgi:hypothetical protein
MADPARLEPQPLRPNNEEELNSGLELLKKQNPSNTPLNEEKN